MTDICNIFSHSNAFVLSLFTSLLSPSKKDKIIQQLSITFSPFSTLETKRKTPLYKFSPYTHLNANGKTVSVMIYDTMPLLRMQ